MHPSLREVDHRPWPLPSTSWKWRQSWLELMPSLMAQLRTGSRPSPRLNPTVRANPERQDAYSEVS